MVALIVSVALALAIALIGIFKAKGQSRRITLVLCTLYVVTACVSLHQGWEDQRGKAKQATSGNLSPVTRLPINKREVAIELGNSDAVINHVLVGEGDTFNIFGGIKGLDWFPIWFRIEKDRVYVSADIRDQTGRIVAIIKDNEWQVNQNNIFDRNYTRNSLEVIDQKGRVVLQVVLVNDTIQVQARFYDAKGRVYTIIGDPQMRGGAISFGPPGSVYAAIHIQPMFRYPSEEHFGEILQSSGVRR